MKTRLFLAATLSLAVSACAPAATTTTGTGMGAGSAPAATTAASVNPVGRYEFTTSVQGQAVTGNMLISGVPGTYIGRILTSITPSIPVNTVTATGQEMVVTGSMPDGILTIRMTFTDGTAFTGSWELSGDTGSLTGRRLM